MHSFYSVYAPGDRVVFAPFGADEPETATGEVLSVTFSKQGILFSILDDETNGIYHNLTFKDILNILHEV